MKKFITLILAGIMVLSLTACGSNKNKEQPTSYKSTTNGDVVQTPTPYKECSSMDEAKAVAGFALQVPDTANGLNKTAILVYDESKMIQVDFGDGDNTVSVRKEAFDPDGEKDISGVYTEYAENNTVLQNNLTINLKGESQKVYVANWSADNYNYSIYSEAGMAQADILALVAQLQ